jgi:hypothetical protein
MVIMACSCFCYSQFDLDYYGEDVSLNGKITSVTIEYYKPVYKDGILTEYIIEPYGIVPRVNKLHYNPIGQVILKEEFDSQCGLDSSCLYSSTSYAYLNGEISKEVKKYANKLIGPEEKVYEYEGDSIVYEKRGFHTHKKSIREFEIEEELIVVGRLVERKYTKLNELGFPEYYEYYKKGELTEREEYTYLENDPKTLSTVTKLSKTKHKVEYNKLSNLANWEFYGTDGSLFSKDTFEYKYDEHSNWTERKIMHKNGKVKVKILRTIVYH